MGQNATIFSAIKQPSKYIRQVAKINMLQDVIQKKEKNLQKNK